jgi:hypothetical protein
VAYRLVRVVQALVSQDNTTKNLVVVSGATVYLADGVTTATVYSDATGTAMSNPVPTGVTPGPTAAGIDTAGNFNAWVDPTQDYALLVNGIKVPLQTSSVHHKDVTDHFDGTKCLIRMVTGRGRSPHSRSQAAAALRVKRCSADGNQVRARAVPDQRHRDDRAVRPDRPYRAKQEP